MWLPLLQLGVLWCGWQAGGAVHDCVNVERWARLPCHQAQPPASHYSIPHVPPGLLMQGLTQLSRLQQLRELNLKGCYR